MGRAPCCDKANVKKGPWSPEEDARLKNFIATHGTGGNWITLPVKAGLRRCGKSCRLRWINYLRPDIKHGKFTEEEAATICRVYGEIGSRWSVIAQQLPGRTDNDIKNFWNTKLKKQLADRGIILPSQRRIFPQNMEVGNYSGPAQIAPGGLLQQMLQQPDVPNYYPPPRPPDYQKWSSAFEGAGQFEVVARSHPVQASPSVAKAEPYDFSQSLLASTTSQQYLHQDQRPWGPMRQSLLEEEEEELKPASSLVRAQLEAMKIEPCQEGADVSRRAALDEVNRLVDEPVCQVTDEKINMLVSIQNEIQSFMEQPPDFCSRAAQTSPATVLSEVGRYRSPSSSCSDSVGGCNNGYETELLSHFW